MPNANVTATSWAWGFVKNLTCSEGTMSAVTKTNKDKPRSIINNIRRLFSKLKFRFRYLMKVKQEFQAPSVTFLTSKGFCFDKDGNETLVSALKEVLTVCPKVNPNMQTMSKEELTFQVFRESDKRIYIPKCFGLQTFGEPSLDKMPVGKDISLNFHGSLRKEQEEPVQKFLQAAQNPLKRGGLLVLPCAYGKTCIALYIACQLKKKTLIVCHKEFLLNQWKERIAQFIPNAKVGMIKQKTVDVKDKDIVLGSLQSLAMKEYDPKVFSDFGFLVLDECHHLGAEVFSNALSKIVCKYTLGLSATPDRKDGLRKVFEWHIGKPVFEVRKRQENHLEVMVKEYYDPHPDYGKEKVLWNGKPNMVQMLNSICSYQPRNEMIIDTLADVLSKEPERRVLILSSRLNHLRTLYKMVLERRLGTAGFYIGGMKQDELKKSEEKQIILASFNIASEGFDVPALNTLILASPVSAIEQSVGRIQRQKPHERQYTPLVIDVLDNFSMFRNQGHRRIAFYKKNGYIIHNDPTACDDVPEEAPQKVDFIEDDSDDEN
jgi:superfamily II DNA or RNA helicase